MLQHPGRPTEVLAALERLADPASTQLRCAVAYATLGGAKDLAARVEARIGPSWAAIAKTLVTCFDFGLTEPSALRYLRDQHGFSLRVSSTPGSSYHPKLFLFDVPPGAAALIGSANLTRAAMTTNTEMAVALKLSSPSLELEAQWNELVGNSSPLSETDIQAYEASRAAQPPPLPPDPPPPVVPPPPAPSVPPLLQAINSGLDLGAFDAMWVEAGSMSSSGSHSQLELPRGANRFFGFGFGTYDDAHHTIGTPVLYTAGRQWSDRPLTWHGNNRMERINLPTLAQGGYPYQDTAILFRRRGSRFQLEVAHWSSAVADAWRTASAAIGQIYRLGRNSTRICGFF